MTTLRRAIEVCDRCAFGKERPSTTERVLSVDDSFFKLKLCESHGQMFDRDISGWTRVASEMDAPVARRKSQYFTDEIKRENARITELRQKANDAAASKEFAERRRVEIEAQQAREAELHARQSVPGGLLWRLTDHARERTAQRGFTFEEVFSTAAFPEHTIEQPWRGPHIAVQQRGDCRIAVNTNTHAIITVIDRNSVLETAPPEGAPQKATAHR